MSQLLCDFGACLKLHAEGECWGELQRSQQEQYQQSLLGTKTTCTFKGAMDLRIDVHLNMTNTPNELSELLNIAVERNWCTHHQCTTCGSNEFRSALDNFDRDELIKQLSELDGGYFDRRGAILMIIYRASRHPMARDLLEPLGDSPAGKFLQKAIEIQELRDHNRRIQEEMSTPEAIAARLEARKAKRR